MTNAELVDLYYKKVDALDIEWVINMFADNCHYQRADAPYVGKDVIEKFYREERKIRGKHTISRILTSDETVVAYGVFNGVGGFGQPKHIEFCDIWSFKNSLVIKRQTYLALGNEYVKE